MKPIETLKNEHRIIEQVLDCLERMAERSATEGRLDGDAAREAIGFFRTFADRCHHGKEESHLFPAMEARGLRGKSRPTDVMRGEHALGREMIFELDRTIAGAEGGNHESCEKFRNLARSYTALLRAHIEKEDSCLFPMAEQILSPSDQAAMVCTFARVEQDEIGPGRHEEFIRLADRLANRFQVTKRHAV